MLGKYPNQCALTEPKCSSSLLRRNAVQRQGKNILRRSKVSNWDQRKNKLP